MLDGQRHIPLLERDQELHLTAVVLAEAAAGQCTAVTGANATELRSALQSANEVTRWQTDSKGTFTLAVRPLLPHEEAGECR